MKYTDAEVDKVALAVREACKFLMPGYPQEHWRAAARAALAARDSLFETVDERWEVQVGGKIDNYYGDAEVMREWAQQVRELTDGVKVVHVTRKRKRKR